MTRSLVRFSVVVTLAILCAARTTRAADTADPRPLGRRRLLPRLQASERPPHARHLRPGERRSGSIAYDPDGSTSHLNPIYEKDDWAKGFDVVVHDECSADVKDLKAIDRILKPHREGPAGRGPALRHALLSQRRLAAKGDSLVRVHRAAFDGPRGPGADRRDVPRQGQPHHAGPCRTGRRSTRSFTTTAPGKPLDTAQPLARGKQTSAAAARDRASSSRSGRTSTTARRGFSARRWGTTTPQLTTRGTWTW